MIDSSTMDIYGILPLSLESETTHTFNIYLHWYDATKGNISRCIGNEEAGEMAMEIYALKPIDHETNYRHSYIERYTIHAKSVETSLFDVLQKKISSPTIISPTLFPRDQKG